MDAIRVRRSVRAYEDRPVPREMIEAIIDAGNRAPCGCNQQRWRFVVVQRGELRQRHVDVIAPTFRRVLGAMVQRQDEYGREYFADMGPDALAGRAASLRKLPPHSSAFRMASTGMRP
ncbi:MAG: nitroreductase family protein [Anaerolineae bacterium]